MAPTCERTHRIVSTMSHMVHGRACFPPRASSGYTSGTHRVRIGYALSSEDRAYAADGMSPECKQDLSLQKGIFQRTTHMLLEILTINFSGTARKDWGRRSNFWGSGYCVKTHLEAQIATFVEILVVRAPSVTGRVVRSS